MEVHYRWHPYCGSKVLVRRVEQRATDSFLQVQGPTGVVISIAGWMLDPVVCAGMVVGVPRVDVAALVELQCRLKGAVKAADSRSDVAIVPEENNAVSRDAVGGDEPPDEFVVRRQQVGRPAVPEWDKIVTTLAQILMQAAGLSVEELEDDER